jgi:hypothetical protein
MATGDIAFTSWNSQCRQRGLASEMVVSFAFQLASLTIGILWTAAAVLQNILP